MDSFTLAFISAFVFVLYRCKKKNRDMYTWPKEGGIFHSSAPERDELLRLPSRRNNPVSHSLPESRTNELVVKTEKLYVIHNYVIVTDNSMWGSSTLSSSYNNLRITFTQGQITFVPFPFIIDCMEVL